MGANLYRGALVIAPAPGFLLIKVYYKKIMYKITFGKILERLALARLLPHLSISPSFSPLQSAYRKFHSTETALLKLTNDIMDAINSGKVTILAALDMSAAFDTLDHTTLLQRLEHTMPMGRQRFLFW